MKRVVIIDDDPLFAIALAAALKHLDYEVHVAGNGAKGLSLIRRLRPDLILCDIIMPVMNGLQVRKSLDRDQELQGIPFLFLSGRDHPDDIALALGLGAQEYLIKPIRLETLVERVQHYLSEPCGQ